jgi:hypothetical protein
MKRAKQKRKRKIKKGTNFQDLVKDVAKVFQPGAAIETGQWIVGPDGRREMDVCIRGLFQDREVFTLIECKDYTYGRSKKPVGIGEVDAFDSKRSDLKADIAVIASNTGFTRPALSKATRKNIGAISVLKRGDSRAKAIIQRPVIFCKKFPAKPIQCNLIDKFGRFVTQLGSYDETLILGRPIFQWLADKAYLWTCFHPLEEEALCLAFRFKEPVQFKHNRDKTLISAAAIFFQWNSKWFTQVVEWDAGTAIFDYVKQLLLLAPGENFIRLKNLNFDKGEPCNTPTAKELKHYWTPVMPGDFRFRFFKLEGIGHVTLDSSDIKAIDSLVEDEDLDLSKFNNKAFANDDRLSIIKTDRTKDIV